MKIELAQKNDALQIAGLHKTEIKKGFLSSLKVSFLEKIYMAIIASNGSFCVVAKEGEEVIGFISGTADINKLYGYFLKKYFVHSFFILLPNFFSISSLRKMIETLWYPVRGQGTLGSNQKNKTSNGAYLVKEKNLPKAELLTMAVASQFHGRGIASKIFLEFALEMKKRNVASFKVLVGDQLFGAINFYEKHNFHFFKKTSVHGNVVSRIYTYDI